MRKNILKKITRKQRTSFLGQIYDKIKVRRCWSAVLFMGKKNHLYIYIRQGGLTLALLGFFIFSVVPQVYAQEVSTEEVSACTVEPFSQTVNEENDIRFTLMLSPAKGSDTSRVTLGNLPGGVTGGFLNGQDISLKDTEREISLKAHKGAQLGSFNVVVLYDVQKGDALEQVSCGFNLIVKAARDRDASVDYIPYSTGVQYQLPKQISDGVISAEPEVEAEAISEDENKTHEGSFMSPLFRGLADNDEVRALQQTLKDAGYFPSWVDTTGYYGPITEAAVTEFQKEHDIPPLGFVGPLTRAALNSLTP